MTLDSPAPGFAPAPPAFTPRDPDWAARARALFEVQNMMRLLGYRLETLRPGAADLSAPIGEATRQQLGAAHAAMAFAGGDTAAGIAAATMLAPGDSVVTLEMKTNFLAPVNGARVMARGRVERAGRSVVVVRAEVDSIDADGVATRAAIMLGTMAVIRPRA